MSRTLSGFAPPTAIERRRAFDQQSAQVMRTLVPAEDDHECTSGRNRNEIRMRHPITLAADHANLVRLERHDAVELTYGLNDHSVKCIAARTGFLK